MCLVRGHNLGALANSRAPWLSLETVQWTLGTRDGILTSQDASSSISCIMKITSQRAVDRAIYLASVVNRAMIGCSLDDQQIGQLAKVM